MTFDTSRAVYDRYMGRYSHELAPLLLAFAGVRAGMRALDVGCGPGALTEALAAELGAERVGAADPSSSFVEACAARVPRADVRHASAEALPWADSSFDAALSQLVVNFMRDAPLGVREMRRVVAGGGVVAACNWDYAGGMQMLRVFWDAALASDPAAPDEGRTMRHATEDSLRELWQHAGLEQVETGPLTVEVVYAGFDEFWEPFTLGAGPGGAYCAGLDERHRAALREECRRLLGDPRGSFRLSARAWAVRGTTPAG